MYLTKLLTVIKFLFLVILFYTFDLSVLCSIILQRMKNCFVKSTWELITTIANDNTNKIRF
jgi:hypothetical protein